MIAGRRHAEFGGQCVVDMCVVLIDACNLPSSPYSLNSGTSCMCSNFLDKCDYMLRCAMILTAENKQKADRAIGQSNRPTTDRQSIA